MTFVHRVLLLVWSLERFEYHGLKNPTSSPRSLTDVAWNRASLMGSSQDYEEMMPH